MTAISIDDATEITTVISTFTAVPGRQQELVTLLCANAATLLRHQDGFIACSIHASDDGTHVLNYAQWRDEKAARAMLADPDIREHAAAVRAIASVQPVRYTVNLVCRAQ
jgi:quinol monooxygenase YgiN